MIIIVDIVINAIYIYVYRYIDMLYSNDVGISNSKPSQHLPEAIKIWVVHAHTHTHIYIYTHDSRIIDIMFALFF